MIRISRRNLLGVALAGMTLPAFGWRAAKAAMPSRPTPEMWAKNPTMFGPCLSPDGNHVAYYRIEGDNKVLYHYDKLANKMSAFTLGPQEIGALNWIDDSHVAITFYRALPDAAVMGLREKSANLILYNLAEKKTTTLLNTWGNAFRVIRDGETQVMVSSANGMLRFELDSDHDLSQGDGGTWSDGFAVTPEGEVIGRAQYFPDKKTWHLLYRNGNGWKEIFKHKSDVVIPSLLGLGRDGKSLVVYIETDSDDGQYFEVDANGTFSEALPAPGISRTAMFDQITFRLCGFATFDGWFSYHYFDPARQALVARAQAAVPGYRMSIQSHADDPRIMIIYSEGDDDAGSNYLINFATGETTDLGALYPDLPAEWLTSKQTVHYKAADGTEIEAYLTLPPGREAKNLPLIVHPHGGPASRDDMSYDWEVQAYASRGYAVLQPNFRGSTGYGHIFEHLGDGQVGRKMQTDLSDGVRFLAAKGMIDLKRVCIAGTSYGGYAALAGAAFDPGVYNCAVSIAGPCDATKWLEIQRGFTSRIDSPGYIYLLRLLGPEHTLDEISPVKHVANITIPILIMHGKDDSVVSANQSTEMVKALQAAGKPVSYFKVEHAEHGATTEASRIEMMRHTLDFVEKYNPPYLPSEITA